MKIHFCRKAKHVYYYSYNEDYFTYILPTFIFPNRMRDVDSMCVIPKHEELMYSFNAELLCA
jgi:hypothetical protein